MTCYPCLSNVGEKRVSPGPIIHEGKYWILEHAYPAKIQGWLVLVLKRHSSNLHNLTENEFAELGFLIGKTTKILHKKTRCKKEYVATFSEAKHFKHIHFHIIPKPYDLKEEEIGPGVFTGFKHKPIPTKQIISFCKDFKKTFLATK